MTDEQHGSTTDRIAELEREIALCGETIDFEGASAEMVEAAKAERSRLRAELSRLRNEPISEARTYPFYGYAPGDYWCNCVEPDCKSKIPGFLDLGKFIGAKWAIRCEPCAEKVARKLSEVGTTPSPSSVEAGRGEREDSLAVLPKRLRGSERYDLAHARQTLERVTVPPAEELAALQGNGEAVASDDDVAEIERLAQSHSVLHWPTLLRVIDRLRKAEANAAPPSNLDGAREALLEDGIRNLCYTAFQRRASGRNSDDGGECDWINDTLPVIEHGIKNLLTTFPSRTGLEEAAWPQARGVSRDADSEQALVVHFDRRLTDDEMRNVHEALRTRAAKTTAPADREGDRE